MKKNEKEKEKEKERMELTDFIALIFGLLSINMGDEEEYSVHS